jgi:hypothetical protein
MILIYSKTMYKSRSDESFLFLQKQSKATHTSPASGRPKYIGTIPLQNGTQVDDIKKGKAVPVTGREGP